MGMAETLWEPGMGPDQLFECISQAMMNAFDRDAISGWGAIVHIIEKDKVIITIHFCLKRPHFHFPGYHQNTEDQDGLMLFDYNYNSKLKHAICDYPVNCENENFYLAERTVIQQNRQKP